MVQGTGSRGTEAGRRDDATAGIRGSAVLSARDVTKLDRVPEGYHRHPGGFRDLLERASRLRHTRMPRKMHLAFDISYIHMDGRWRMPHAWAGGAYPDIAMFEEIARIAERGCLDMIFSGDGTGIPSTWRGS